MFRKTAIALLLAASGVSAHAALSAGDIAIIGRINNATTDSFAFVTLSNIAAGEIIYFTDNGWTGSLFRGASTTDGDGNENLARWTAATNIAAGTIIASTSSSFASSSTLIPGMTQKFGNLDLSQSGEQITAFQSSAATNPMLNPTTALYVFDDSNGFENATSSSTGNIPTGLVNGTTAITLNQMTAGAYSVKASVLSGTTKTKDQWLATFANSSNWETVSSLQTGSILVTAVPEPKNYAMLLAGLGLMGFIARRRNSR